MLAAAQVASSAHRLNERNCVEIVAKLVSQGKLTVLNTSSGVREFVTPERLSDEVNAELRSLGGRVVLEDLVVRAGAGRATPPHVRAHAPSDAADPQRGHCARGARRARGDAQARRHAAA